MHILQICQILLQLSFKTGFRNLATTGKLCLQSEADGTDMVVLSPNSAYLFSLYFLNTKSVKVYGGGYKGV